MSEQTPEEIENAAIDAATGDYTAYIANFEKKHGYGVGVLAEPAITGEGYIQIVPKLKLIKLEPVVASENPATTPDNGNSPTEETSASDNTEQPAPEAAQ